MRAPAGTSTPVAAPERRRQLTAEQALAWLALQPQEVRELVQILAELEQEREEVVAGR